jgi:formylglycine-generating enzyme required for sulfatase activity
MVAVACRALCFAWALSCAPQSPGAPVAMQWVTVGDPGNLADPTNFRGSVLYSYQISKYDTTNSQYVEFLNAKDPTGANALGLYDSRMTTDLNVAGINFDASEANGSKYSAINGSENHPVAYVTFYSAVRFANWLNNGQGNASTETGSYTLLGGTAEPSNGQTLQRNPGNGIFVPTENEWYKAAYYKGGGTSSGYWLYATQSDVRPASAPPSLTATNSANYLSHDGNYAVTGSSVYDPSQNYLTDVGAYGASPSAYGTFDQNGDLFQWLESTTTGFPTPFRRIRGGSWGAVGDYMGSSIWAGNDAHSGESFLGFRVVLVPDPVGGIAVILFGAPLLVGRPRPSSRAGRAQM